jgi:transcriptional regulator NrdR family protein
MVRKTSSKKTTSKKKPVKRVKKAVKKKPIRKKAIKRAIKKTPRKKPTEVHSHSTKEIKVEKALIENFIGLQKVMVNLSSRFDELSGQISKLLNLFEVSARAMAKKDFDRSQDPDLKKVLDKLDNLTQQAGLIGHGLALIHKVNEEKHRDKEIRPTHFKPQPSPTPVNPILRNPNLKPVPHPQGRAQGNMGMQPSIMKSSSVPTPTHVPQRTQKAPQSQTKEIDENSVHEENV